MADSRDTSAVPSNVSSLSKISSKQDDLDLDSLFARLDKYTAEMDAIDKRLRRARSNSERSDGINFKRFSFEDRGVSAKAGASTPPPNPSNRTSQQRLPPNKRSGEGSGRSSPAKASKSSRSSKSRREHASLSTPLSPKVISFSKGRNEALALLNEYSEAQEEEEKQNNPQASPIDWKAWAEQQVPAKHAPQGRSSSRYSQRAESLRNSRKHGFVFRKSSPPPPLKETRRTASLQQANALKLAVGEKVKSEQDYVEYFSEDDEPGPSLPTSWTLPPRSSSRRVLSDESLPPGTTNENLAGDELVQEEGISSAPSAPPRRMTTSEARPSIRNGGFWADHKFGSFEQKDVPPIPPLSASNSNATLKSSPPLTPLTISDPREDQTRRELETFSIHEGAEALEHRYKKRRPPMLNFLDSDEEKEDSTPVPTPPEPESSSLFEDDERSLRPVPRRRKSIFSIFQRKSPVEKLIDMYFDDEPEVKPILKRRSTWSRKGSPVQERMPMSPAIPPQFQYHGKQTSL